MRSIISKSPAESAFLGLGTGALALLWFSVALLGVFLSYSLITLAFSISAITPLAFTYDPFPLFAGLLSSLITALWIGGGFFGGVTVYYNIFPVTD